MDIQNIRSLKDSAAHALRIGRDPKKVVLYYAGITALLAAALTVCNYWLSQQISSTGGLSNLGTRAIFSTAQAMLPIIQTVSLLCLDLGYLHAMMRVSRKQYADHTDLKVGFQRFAPLLRLILIQGLIYAIIGIGALALSMQIFLLSPWSDRFLDIVLSLAECTYVCAYESICEKPRDSGVVLGNIFDMQ